MTTLTDKELIKEIKERIGSLDVRDNIERRAYEIALASLEAEPVAKIIAHYPLGIDVGKQKFVQAIGELPDFGGHLFAAPPVPVVPEEKPMPNPLSMYAVDAVAAIAEVRGWNACRAAMLQSGNFRENKNSSTNNFREIAETSTNYPVIPSEVLSAILKVAKIRADFDDFDGDRRGIGDCLDEAEQELIVTINKYASQLAAEPIATNDVREQQTAVPPVPEIQDDVAQAIENLKQKLVECNRYNYCADAVKGVEDACHAAMLQGRERLVLDAATRTAAGGEMMDVKEKVLQVMRSRAALQDKALGGEYPFRMATWNLRLAMEKEFPDEEWRSADLRKILMELAKDGTVSKDTHASRIGQAVWRLEVR